MSVATVVTRGFGSFGTVGYVATAGYDQLAAAAYTNPLSLGLDINRTVSETTVINRTASLGVTINRTVNETEDI